LGTQWDYRPEGKKIGGNPVQKNAVICKIATAKSWSNTQVVLTWALQRGVSVIPRSSKAKHIIDNGRIFDKHSGVGEGGGLFPEGTLSAAELQELDALDGTLERGQGDFSGGDNGDDDPSVEATFKNTNSHEVELYWVDGSGKNVLIATVKPGEEQHLNTHHMHKFVAAYPKGAPYAKQLQVDRADGQKQEFTIKEDGVYKSKHREL
jgi:hypothetical protein